MFNEQLKQFKQNYNKSNKEQRKRLAEDNCISILLKERDKWSCPFTGLYRINGTKPRYVEFNDLYSVVHGVIVKLTP